MRTIRKRKIKSPYWDATYKKRFFKTLWLIPVWIILLTAMIVIGTPVQITVIVSFLFASGIFLQASANHRKWKHEELKDKFIRGDFD